MGAAMNCLLFGGEGNWRGGDKSVVTAGPHSFLLVLALWNVMGLHYTVNSSTSKKFLALGSSFWRGLGNFGYVFAIFCTRQLVSKNFLHYVMKEYILVL